MKSPSKLVLYVIAGVVSFFFWILVVFPYDALKSRILTEIENQTRGRYIIEAKDMDFSIFGSMTFKNLEVIERGAEENKVLGKVPKLKIDFSPFIIFTRNLDVGFTLYGRNKGQIVGYIEKQDKYYDVDIEIKDYSLSDIDFIPYRDMIPLQGKIKGNSKLKFFPKISTRREEKSDGNLDFKIEQLNIGPIVIDSMPPMFASQLGSQEITIPQIKVSSKPNAKMSGKLSDRRLSLDFKMGDPQNDFAVDLTGTVNLNINSFRNSNLSFRGSLYLSDNQIRSIANANRPKNGPENSEFDMGTYVEILKSMRNDKGQFPVIFSGTFSNIRSFKLAGNELM